MSMVVITTYMPTLMRVPEREGLKAAAAANISAVLLASERGCAAAAVKAGELCLDADVACKLFISSGADPRPRSPVTHPYEIRSGARAASPTLPPRLPAGRETAKCLASPSNIVLNEYCCAAWNHR